MATRESRRVCHWALRTGNLRDALTFYELVFGLRILRHEEFAAGHPESGGAYGGAWSKTVVGWGPERTDFALELTYSYGADDTTQADGLLHIAVACPEAATRAAALGYAVAYDRGAPVVAGPDDVKYKIVEPSSGRAERWSAVCLKSASLRSTERYFVDVLGWTKFARPPPGCATAGSSLTLGFDGDDQADVDVSVLADPDGYEVAVVGAAGFYDLARPRYDVVDWRLRESRGAGRDAAPASTAPLATPGMVNVHDAAALDALASSQDRVVAHFAAKWCKNCARIEPELAAMAAKTDARAPSR
ncbi:methylglyoxalase [Aureococcus anophagefferens]|uniref:Methylglyoxalase n=1 Tax=Aureococcus anophagefferens TaxID=44056 RepID=A0ABR1GB88_AURAN